MSSRATGTSSFTQKYCCRSREPQVLCSRLKEIALLASVAEKSFTGIDTSPNEIVKLAIDRAAIHHLRLSSGLLTGKRLQEALLARQGVGPTIADLREPLG